jgi:hypothetical protein
MRNSLSVSVVRKGSGYLINFQSDSEPQGLAASDREDVAMDMKEVRGKIVAFLDTHLVVSKDAKAAKA